MDCKGKKFRSLIYALLFIPLLWSCSPKESTVQQRKIDRDREKKGKIAKKNYEKAVTQHNKNQSGTTKTMMKKARKDKKKYTPLKHSSGPKCK